MMQAAKNSLILLYLKNTFLLLLLLMPGPCTTEL
jgi:hypothetical protein